MLAGGKSYLSGENFDEQILDNVQKVDRIEVDGAELTAKSAREIILRANETPLGDMRLLLIRNAGEMSDIIQNSLLKLLEEPPKQLAVLLLTDNDSRLLPTVRSRLEKLTMTASQGVDAAEVTLEELTTAKDRQALIAKLTVFRENLRREILKTGSKLSANRLIVLDRALTRLSANCSQKLVLDSLLLQWNALSDIE